jgi:carbon starvation protein CstA
MRAPRAAGRSVSWMAGETRRPEMSLGTILLIVLVLMLIGVVPAWPHSSGWGYGPSGALGVVLLVVIVLLVLGKL